MIMNEKHISILEAIVELKGDCLDAHLCKQCPFKKQCLPNFLQDKQKRPTQKERFNLALDTITNISLLGDQDIEYSRDK